MDVQDSLHRLQVQVLTTQRRLRYADYHWPLTIGWPRPARSWLKRTDGLVDG